MSNSTLYDYDVFLSFAGEDEEQVKPLWNELSYSGLKVFWSNKTLKKNVGQSFFNVIQSALEGSEHFVLFCTNHSMASSWVREEYETFFSQCYIPSNKERRLILYHGSDFDRASTPPFLKNLQTSESIKEIASQLGGVDVHDLIKENIKLKNELSKLKAEKLIPKDNLEKSEKKIKNKILLVDDEENIHKYYKEELEEKGYKVYSAYSGEESLEIFDKISPDLVILDIKMPGMDGLEVLSKIRLKDNKTPIVLCSAYGEHMSSVVTWAAQDYIVKSADLKDLLVAVERHLRV